MIAFQGRSSLKQYLPLKPVKQGIKVWCRADSYNGYICEFQIYTGKQESEQRETTLGERVVLDLTQKLEGSITIFTLITFYLHNIAVHSSVQRAIRMRHSSTGLQGLPCGIENEGQGK